MNFNIIKKNFDKGLWSESMVKMAVRKGVITQDEYAMILEGVSKKDVVAMAIEETIGILTGEVAE